MAYKKGMDRSQSFIIPSLDFLIPDDSIARVIDSFVNTLDLSAFTYSTPNTFGNRPYDPATLLKIYLLAYHLNIRSSRKIENALNFNLQFIWISHNLKIKHTTIADFRKDNHSLLKDIMFQFNLDCKNLQLISNVDSLDGTKIKAVNSKDNNFTLNKLDDRIKRLKDHIEDFEALFDAESDYTTLEDLLNKVLEYDKKKNNFESLRAYLEKNNLSQISLTDPDSKLMKNNEKFEVSYNNQVCVDTVSHIVKDFQLTTNPNDLGSICSISSEIQDVYDQAITTNITDKGYYQTEDMVHCLENGIIPEVTPTKGKDYFVLETVYEENEITDEMKNSTNKEDIKKCLRAGVIPNVYKDKISDIEVKECFILEQTTTIEEDESTLEEKRDFAMNNQCFVRSKKENVVFCPQGERLRRKSRNGNKTRYCNKLACKNCKNPCCPSKFKTVDFSPNQIIVGKNIPKEKWKRKKVKIKKVTFSLIPDKELLKLRTPTSEHSHGSLKFWDNARYLLLKGIEKATGEMALYYCAYNIRRASNIIGNYALIEYFKNKNIQIFDSILDFYVNKSVFLVKSLKLRFFYFV